MSFRKYEIPSDFKVLPMDIIYKIFSNFTPKELCTLTAVSKWFCYFSSLEELWRGHCTKDLNCKLQRITSPSWKQHYLDIYKLERSLERDLLEKITFSTILKIKSKFDKDWENILLSLIEHSPLSFNIFGRCIDTTTKEIFASFLHWIISHGTEISIRWIMEYCFTLEDGIQRALSPTSSSELNSNDYTPPLLLAAYLGKENIVKFILEWLDTMKLTEVYSNEGISHHEIQSIVQSNPIIVPRKEMSIGRSNSYKLSPVFPFALSPPGKNSVFSPSSPNLSPLSNIIPNNNNKPFYPPIMSVSVPNHISKTSPHQSAPQINQLIVNNENLQNNSPINFSPINFIVGNNNFIAQNLNQHFARPNCPQSIPNSKILIQQRGAGGTSAIQLAAGQGHFGIVKYLLEKGSSPNITDKNGNSPLHAAAIHGHLDCLQLLIDSGGNAKTMTKRGRNLLHLAVVNPNNTQVLEYLISNNKSDMHRRTEDEDGYTPLHIASKFGCISAVKVLLKNGADIHARSLHGNTPLQEAAQNGQTEVVRLLKRYEDNNGFSASRGGSGAGRVIIDDGCSIS